MTRKDKYTLNHVENFQLQVQNNSTNKSEKFNWLRKFELGLGLLRRASIGFITLYICWMCLRLKWYEIPWHALLCTVGFVLLMSEGLSAHYRSNECTQNCHRSEKTRTHWLFQLFGSGIGLVGIILKILLEKDHFVTMHGKLGLATLLILLLSLLSGLSSIYANELRVRMQPLLNKALHSVLGLITYTLAMLSMYYAFDTDIFLEYSLDAAHYADFRILLGSMTLTILALSSYGPLIDVVYSKLWKCC